MLRDISSPLMIVIAILTVISIALKDVEFADKIPTIFTFVGSWW